MLEPKRRRIDGEIYKGEGINKREKVRKRELERERERRNYVDMQ